MVKRLFTWSPGDIAYWEKIHVKGLRHFIGWYGMVISAGSLFILFSLVTIYTWLRQSIASDITSGSLLFLGEQLIFVATVCTVTGVINSLITWVVEERLYRKYKIQYAARQPDINFR